MPDEFIDENGFPKPRKETPFSRKEWKERIDNMFVMGPEQGRVGHIEEIIIGPTSNFETQKHAVEDMIKQLAHRSIYPYMLKTQVAQESPDANNISVGGDYIYYRDGRYFRTPKISQSKIPFKP